MTDEEMHKVLDGLAVGDKVHVWITGSKPADYTVTSITGRRAREFRIKGARGSVFVVSGEHDDITATSTKRGAKPRKVRELVTVSDKRMQVALADAAFAARRLPSGYSIETYSYEDAEGRPGTYHRAMFGSELIPRGLAVFGYSDPNEAVIDAWAHYADTQVREHEKTVKALADAVGEIKVGESRCRRALQQISEIAHGLRPSSKALSDDCPPEQVVADVAHAMLLR